MVLRQEAIEKRLKEPDEILKELDRYLWTRNQTLTT
jgi:hypothetical protein